MQAPEIELKFPVNDLTALQNVVPQLGFQLVTARTFEQNTLYDTPSRELRQRREILRIRQYGHLCTVTHKRQSNQEPVDTTRYKIRIET
jgi:adenylate cyclase, class 2